MPPSMIRYSPMPPGMLVYLNHGKIKLQIEQNKTVRFTNSMDPKNRQQKEWLSLGVLNVQTRMKPLQGKSCSQNH